MNGKVFAAAFGLGLLALAWVGMSFIGTSPLALVLTAVIAGVYVLGALELRQYRAATSSLALALTRMPQPLPDVGAWLEQVPLSLRNPVRLRVEGERIALPGPALTPYLVGLLVMLGMLGTFLGMVVTFKGAVFALEGSTDLQAIRAALSAPIKGLGLSFGTSVAGVAASAMLGLMSAISRRERLEVARLLDTGIATTLRPFSLAHQRQEAFKALQMQAGALPEVVDRLQAMMDSIERRSEQLDARLRDQQEQFHRDVTVAYTGLADRVGQALQSSLVAGATAAGESIRPVVETAMAGMAKESQRMHQRVFEVTHTELANLSAHFEATGRTVSDGWAHALQTHTHASEGLVEHLGKSLDGFMQRVDAQATSRAESEARWTQQQGDRMDQLTHLWHTELGALRDLEAARGDAAVLQLGELQAALASHLATLGAALEAPMTRLMQTAAEVPQAASGVMAQLRQEMSRLTERDNLALEERAGLMHKLTTLLETLQQASAVQQTAIENLVSAARTSLDQAGNQFSHTLEAQADKASDLSAHVQASAIDLSSLGAAFHHSIELFSASNDRLTASLQHIEAALGQSMARSDEQLAYYVAQAREVIDLSLSSQQEIVEDMRRLRHSQPAPAEGLPA